MNDYPPAKPPNIRGRGTSQSPPNRFKPIGVIPEEDTLAPGPSPETQFFTDTSKTILAENDSPDIGFNFSLNPYRGCEHGCIYCYARPTHEYFELSAGLDFETKILVKENAAKLLEQKLSSRRWRPQVIVLSGVTDPYQPGEKALEITRRCLEVLLKFRNPVAIITKNNLVTRDIDLLGELARFQCAAVYLSITTLDNSLSRFMEPRASLPAKRLEAVRKLNKAKVPVGVMAAPVIPALTDHELPSILSKAAEHGARFAGFTVVRLPYGVKDLFAEWLETHYPNKKKKVLNRIRAVRGGKLNDPKFSSRMKGEGVFAEQIASLFSVARRKAGIPQQSPNLSTDHFTNWTDKQLPLFKK